MGIYLEDSDNNKLMSDTRSKLWNSINLIDFSNNELNSNLISHNYFSLSLVNLKNNKVLNNNIVELGYSYSVILAHSQIIHKKVTLNTLKGNIGGLNTEIKVVYGALNSINSTLDLMYVLIVLQNNVIYHL